MRRMRRIDIRDSGGWKRRPAPFGWFPHTIPGPTHAKADLVDVAANDGIVDPDDSSASSSIGCVFIVMKTGWRHTLPNVIAKIREKVSIHLVQAADRSPHSG